MYSATTKKYSSTGTKDENFILKLFDINSDNITIIINENCSFVSQEGTEHENKNIVHLGISRRGYSVVLQALALNTP